MTTIDIRNKSELDMLGVSLRTLRPECYGGQHDYQQGLDAEGCESEGLRKLLFCSRCGDVIKFSLPVTVEMP